MTNNHSTPQLAEKMREMTLSFGRVMKAKATVHHRRKESRSGAAVLGSTGIPEVRHSPSQPQNSIVDAYGFEHSVTTEQEEAMARRAAQQERQLAKWQACSVPGSTMPAEDRLKKLCRQGVPPQLRRWVWSEVSGATARRTAGGPAYYAAAVDAGRSASPCEHQIKLDAPRTFPNCGWIQSDGGQASLRRVLYAFAHHNPAVGYCQGMNYVAALLLLVMGHNEEAAFWVLASLIDDDRGILYQDTYSKDLSGCHVEMRSLRELVDAKLPRLAAHLEELRCDMSIIATDWFLCLFSTSLPAETAIRVWDALLHEGPKVLFRVALALLKIYEPMLLAADNPGDLLRVTRNAAAEEFDCDELMRVAFDGVGSLPMERIARSRSRNHRTVERELAGREVRMNLRSAMKEGYVLTEAEEGLLRELEGTGAEEGRELPRGQTGWRGGLQGLAAVGSALGEKTRSTLESVVPRKATKS